MKWGAPDILYALWLIVPVAYLAYLAVRRRRRMLSALVSAELTDSLSAAVNRRSEVRRTILTLTAAAFIIIALAQPKWGFHWEEVKQRGLDIMVVLDTSNSMLTEDVRPNRLQQAKWGVRDLTAKLKGDRIGLVAFAGSSFLQCPLTIDYTAFLLTLDDVYAGLIPRGGTAIEQALRTAMESFEDQRSSDRVIILITDGEDHEGDPLSLLDDLKAKGIIVYSIGVGSLEGELIPSVDQQGHPGFLKDRAGQVVKSSLHEDELQKLAWETGGTYVRSAPGDFGLERIYEQGIAGLQRDESESRMMKSYEHRFMWFLLIAYLLFVIEAVLPQRLKGSTSRTGGPNV